MINEKRLLENFLNYVQIDSETGDEKEMCDYLSKQLTDLGFEVIKDEAGKKINSNGYNILAKYPGDPSKDAILLSSHVDTVTPGKGIKPIIDGDIIKTDGSTILAGDDKAGVAIIVECMTCLLENNVASRPIEAVFTIFEEGGLHGAKNFDISQLKAKEGIVTDSGGDIGTIITEGPAQDVISVTLKGKSAHAGIAPEEGISAIEIMARAIDNMPLGRIDSETTANVGIIKGGQATNIVCDLVEISAEARSISVEKLEKQTKAMVDAFEKAAQEFGGEADIKVSRSYNPIKVDVNSKLVQDLAKAFEENDIKPQFQATGGGSDTNVFFEKGITCLNVSCGMSNVHTTDEFIKISDMNNCAKSILTFLKM